MFEQGSIGDEERVRLLILYGLRAIGQLIPYDSLTELFITGGEINYFDLLNNIDELSQSGHMDIFEKDGVKVVCLTPMGEEALNCFEKRIPYSVRESTSRIALRISAKLLYKSQVYADIVKSEENGGWNVVCNMKDRGQTVFKLSLNVANQAQAKSIAETFENDAGAIYGGIISLLTDKKENSQED